MAYHRGLLKVTHPTVCWDLVQAFLEIPAGPRLQPVLRACSKFQTWQIRPYKDAPSYVSPRLVPAGNIRSPGSGWLSAPWLAGPKVPVELGPTPARISGRAQIAQNSGRALRLLVYIYRIDQCSAQAGAPGFFQLVLHFVLLARLSEFATQGAK